MPIKDVHDAGEVENHIKRIFAAAPPDRAAEIRNLFVETLDFDANFGQVSLVSALGAANALLPGAAERIAQRGGVHVVYVALDIADTDRVRAAEASTAARVIADQLGDDLLLVFTNTSNTQVHFIHPNLEGARPVLRRMVVERDLPRRTAVQQVANIYWDHRRSGDIRAALESAFDVERVTRRFFDEYKRIFETAERGVTGFGDDKDSRRLFVQTLFNRLMFVYFLQRKGWLTFKGDNDYLNALWKDYKSRKRQSNFYVDRLKLLFFSGLNNPQSFNLVRDNPVVYAAIGNPPFLNGGLFERTDLDRRDGIEVPDEALEQVLRDLFDKFNFTVMESTPFDIEVAVDPEMLGKVFEELVTDRHGSGSYYTPRPVVSFMCREALKGFLQERETGLTAEAIALFVDKRETSGITPATAPKVGGALDEVTVVDPACGSGAYLLGMMQELVELHRALYNVRVDPRNLYELKLHIIERNLYGADNDEFAVNIAMLRLWLSLAIDYEGESPESLPNLEFKIVCGDSLLGPDPSQLSLERGLIERSRIGEYKADYMRESNVSAKAAFKKRVSEAENGLRESIGGTTVPHGVVDWRIAFAEVLGERGGFDVAIANPPYVRQENIKPASYKSSLKKAFTDGAVARSDLFCYFYVRALQLLRNGGMHVFVCSNSWLDTRYGISLQKYLLSRARIHAVYDSAIQRQFSTAAVNTIITLIQKGLGQGSYQTRFVSLRDDFELAIFDSTLRREVTVGKHTLSSARFGAGNWGGRYLRAPDIYRIIIEAASNSDIKLEDLVRGERYLNTGGADGFFILTDVVQAGKGLMKATIRSKEGRDRGIPEFLIESQFLRPGYRRTDSTQLEIDNPDCYVLVIPSDVNVTQYRVSDYIAWGQVAGFDQRSVTRTQSPWWRPPLQAQDGATILWPRTHSESHRCYYNPKHLVSLRFFRLHPKNERHVLPILALLNSTVFAMLKEIHGRRALGHGALETGLMDILPLPLVNLSSSTCNRLAAAVKPLLRRPVGKLSEEVSRSDRRNLDEIVLEAYGLRAECIQQLYDSVIEIIAMRRKKAKTIG